jgi:hypothetical protein
MKRRRLIAFAGALAVLLVAGAPPLPAQGDKDPKPGKKDDPKETPVGRACVPIGAEFRQKKSQALVDRVRPKGRLHLALGKAGEAYSAEQAKALLEQWFKDKKELKVELKSVTGMTGKFDLTYREEGSDKLAERTLCITLEERAKSDGTFLAKIEILA